MDNIQLKYLLDLDYYGSFAKVANNSFTSHQVIRNSIIALEKELNVKLVSSTNQGTCLTPAGNLLKDFALKYTDDFKVLQEELNKYRNSESYKTQISLYMSPIFSSEYYLNLLTNFKAKNPNLILEIYFSYLPQMFYNISSPYTIGLTLVSSNEETMRSFYKKIAEQNLHAFCLKEPSTYYCVRKNSKLAKHKLLRLEMIENITVYTFINSNPFCMPNEESNAAHSTSQTSSISYFSSYQTLKQLLKSQDCVAIVYKNEFEYYFGANSSEYVLIPSADQNIKLMVSTTMDNYISEEIQNLLNFLKTLL